jgi:hypothetical protein
VAWGTGQNVYTTFSWNRPGETDATLVARSTDGGRTFEPATVAIPGLPRTTPEKASVVLSELAYPGGGEAVSVPIENNRTVAGPGTRVVIANADDTAAALAGSVLARANNGPVLLTPAAGLSKTVVDEVKRLQPTGAYLVGDVKQLSEKVRTDLAGAGVPGASIVRLDGAGGPELARQVAQTLDIRSDADKAAAKPAFDTAVVVDPDRPEAPAAAAFAAAQRLPFLFVGAGAVPSATTDAIKALGVTKTIVVGGPGSVGDAVLGQLPSASRLGADSAEATSEAVAKESVGRGMPANVVYQASEGEPAVAAALGAAVARLGGIQLVTAGGGQDAIEASIGRAGLGTVADRAVSVRTSDGGKANVALIVVEVAAILVGIGLLLAVARPPEGDDAGLSTSIGRRRAPVGG